MTQLSRPGETAPRAVGVDHGTDKVPEAYGDETQAQCIIRRGFRAGTYVATYKFKLTDLVTAGWVVRWVSPGDWVAVALGGGGGNNTRLYRRKSDGAVTTLTTGSSPSLTVGVWYTAKVVVDESGGSQRLRC